MKSAGFRQTNPYTCIKNYDEIFYLKQNIDESCVSELKKQCCILKCLCIVWKLKVQINYVCVRSCYTRMLLSLRIEWLLKTELVCLISFLWILQGGYRACVCVVGDQYKQL